MNESGENQPKKCRKKRVNVVTVRMVKEAVLEYSGKKITDPSEGVQLLQMFFGDIDREMFVAAYLNNKKEINAIHTVSIGTVNASLVHPREVFKAAILSNASSVLVAHNHPSGSITPSQEDKDLTKRLAEAGRIVGIELIDHLILGDSGRYFSFKKEGLL